MLGKILLMASIPVCAALTILASEPTVMTINGRKVPKSEFQYLFNKNNQQQLVPQTIDEYVDMFKIYKLKVADAIDMGIDTTASFKKEIESYRKELAAPFIADSIFINKMIKDSYNHLMEEVEVSFIKIPKSRNPLENGKLKNRADSLLTLLQNGADFAEIAANYSSDPAAAEGGYHGYMSSAKMPYTFEQELYSLKPGKLSGVVELYDGYYIIKPGSRRPAQARMEVAHILRLVPQSASEDNKTRLQNEMDSIYNILVQNPERFGIIAKQFSDDKMSGRQEGKLPVFGSGEMIPEFEEVARTLQPGEISKPFLTRYGWHIIKKHKDVPLDNYDQFRASMLQRISNPQDERYRVVRDHELQRLVDKYKGRLDSKIINRMKTEASAGIDSLYLANWTTMPQSFEKAGKIGKETVTAGDILSPLKNYKGVIPADQASTVIDRLANNALQQKALELEEANLYKTEPEYRNLLDEYTDGSLLYEVSLIKVWDKGSKDIEGMDTYFQANRNNFKWDKPRAKGILVQSLNDSVSSLVRDRLQKGPNDQKYLEALKKEFSGKALIDLIVVEEGVNPMVDNIMFGGPAAKPRFANFNDYFLFDAKIITAPEEASDVRGEVASAYQNALEKEWIEELLVKYPVVINYDVINKMK